MRIIKPFRIFFTLGTVVRIASLALTSYLAHRTVSVRSLFTEPYSFKNPMYICDAIFFSSPQLAKKRRQICCLGFSSRSDSFAFCALHKPAQYPRYPDYLPSVVSSVRKSALGLLAFTRFSIPFRNFILKFLHSINLAHMGSFVPAQNPLHNKYYQYIK